MTSDAPQPGGPYSQAVRAGGLDFDEFNTVYREFFGQPYPARTTVGSSLRGIEVEVDVIAVAPAMPEPGGGVPRVPDL